ncbi:hypothetical protein Q0Z83_022130 [Actinoplanes sichuanensis]|uniref:TIR domain-containing protein n=1 Tax=Actinoplanes sichuanensis TaxID=512349 RepID=A0ABW4AI35_9ACTN|nr:TIR domain-containing protein [Actinoplanes sichuanensis]BEL04022.1 hypothetical protein Q0Z83_022130 [Actinoplanes sichuanensis]
MSGTPIRQGVFISFRTGDGNAQAAHLDEILTPVFGADRIFRSSRSIPPGAAFPGELDDALARSCVTLVLIGETWTRRLGGPDDWVRREVATSLAAGIPVVPVLLDKTTMPPAEQLASDVRGLAERQALHLRTKVIAADLAALVAAVHEIAPGLAARHLTAPARILPDRYAPSALLLAEHRIVDFAGREPELARLADWRDGPEPVAVALITGPAGQGKSRLAVEFCDRSGSGWVAGLLSPDAPSTEIARLGPAGIPALIVIDYAETAETPTLALLTALVARPAGAAPARVLLLARGDGFWLDRMTAAATDERAALLLMDLRATGHLNLTGPAPIDVGAAARAFATRLGRPAPAAVPEPDDATIRPPLELLTTALDAVLRDTAGPSLPSRDPVIRLLHHERRHWRTSADAFELPDPNWLRLNAAVAAATLYGGRPDAETTLAALPAFRQEQQQIVQRWARWLRHLYPPGADPAGHDAPHALRPDRLGEEHVTQTVLDQPEIAGPASAALPEASIARALLVLGRAAPRHPDLVGVLTGLITPDPGNRAILAVGVAFGLDDPAPIAQAINGLFDGTGGHGPVAHRLIDAIPAELPAFAPLLATVTARVLEAEHSSGRPDLLTVARVAQQRAIALTAGGDPAEALRSIRMAQAALTALRQTSAADPATATLLDRLLGQALAVDADCLHALGLPEDAIDALTAAVAHAPSPDESIPTTDTDPVPAWLDHVPERAAQAISRARRHGTELPGLLRLLAHRLTEAGRTDEAEPVLRRWAVAARAEARLVEETLTAWALDRSRYPSEKDVPPPPGLPPAAVRDFLPRMGAVIAADIRVRNDEATAVADAATRAGVLRGLLPDAVIPGEHGARTHTPVVTLATPHGLWALYRETRLGWQVGPLRLDAYGDFQGVGSPRWMLPDGTPDALITAALSVIGGAPPPNWGRLA